VRVRVKKNNQVTGSSKLSQFIARTVDDDSIENRLVQARDILYEEELFHELTREARTLVSSGVTTRRNLIQFEFNDGEEILFDLVDMDNAPDESDVINQTEEHNTVAEAVAHVIRILLSYSHRQNLLRRTQIPPPLTTKKRPLPEYHLLRPVLAYLQHNAHIQSLQSFLRDIYLVLKCAGLESEYTATPFASLALLSSHKNEPTLSQSSSSPSASTHIDTLLHNFLEPLESKFSGTMANHQTSTFATKIRTNLSGPSLGTEYDFSIRLPNFPHTQPPSRIGLREEVENVITHLILLDLTTFISSVSKKKKKASNNSNSNAKVEHSDDTKDQSLIIWEAPFAHHGELVALSPSARRMKKLFLHLSRTELTIRTSWLGGDGSSSSSSSSSSSLEDDQDKTQTQTQTTGKILYSWTLDDAEKPTPETKKKKKTLEDVIVEVSDDDVVRKEEKKKEEEVKAETLD
jgi:mediator of RNA polymerase II transcription subunit 17